MIRIPFDKNIFHEYEDEHVIAAWKWFMSFISEDSWEKRKKRIERKLIIEHSDISKPLTEGTLLSINDDKIGWYLYLIDTLINAPYKYEFFQGARILPIFKRFGIYLEEVKGIKGIDVRIKDLINKRKSEADNLIFELLTALMWKINGYDVEFVPEKNNEKTPDIFVKKGQKEFYVECKRQSKTSDYAYNETCKRQKMIQHISKMLLDNNIVLDIKFHIEIVKLDDTYLKEKLESHLKKPKEGKIVSDEELEVNLSFVNIKSISSYIEKDFLKNNSPALNDLISKQQQLDNKSFTSGIKATFYRIGEGEVNNLYISSISNAFGVIWSCDNEESIWTKARDIKSLVYKAIKQFNSEQTGIIHIGMETYDGPEVELKRFEKIRNTIDEIDSASTSLEWIFCNFFQSYTKPNQYWIFDETVTQITNLINPTIPLKDNFMVVVNDESEVENNLSHWEKPLP